MKIFFIFSILVLVICGSYYWPRSFEFAAENIVYINSEHGYQVTYTKNFEIDSSRPELVTLRAGNDWLRINMGCFDFGTENLVATNEFVSIGKEMALKQTYYGNSKLKFIRYVMTSAERCIYLEIFPYSEYGREVLEGLVKSFRIL